MIEEYLKSHGDYYNNKCFKDLTTVKIGGHIKHFILPNTVEDLKDVIDYLKTNRIPFKIFGNGSNLICGETEYDGVVICLKKLNSYEIYNDEAYIEAGVLAPSIANTLGKMGLSSLEFAGGIPGTIGGLIYMNAGAYKGSMSDVINEVLVLKDNEFVWLTNKECNFAYRNSIFKEHPHWVIIACKIRLVKKSSEIIEELMADRLERRKKTQPLDMPSAGSTFRNPDGGFAWELIDGINYRGYQKNGACVSEKHSNFIVNKGDATADDYLGIAYEIIDKVKAKYGIKLIMEVEKFNC